MSAWLMMLAEATSAAAAVDCFLRYCEDVVSALQSTAARNLECQCGT